MGLVFITCSFQRPVKRTEAAIKRKGCRRAHRAVILGITGYFLTFCVKRLSLYFLLSFCIHPFIIS
jgi:hypothetical protein